MNEQREIAIRETEVELSLDDVKRQVAKIHDVMESVMQEGVHYGTIPGVSKPSLLKAGAEKLGLTFRLAPEFAVTRSDLPNGHREFEVTCTLRNIPTGAVVGQGVGSCSTMESKYRYRTAAITCPHCGKDTVIKGKEQYGGGWLCYKKKGGCGAKWPDGAPVIEQQQTGRVDNPDIADTYNTVLKMAKKRAHVDAMLTATAASDILTQDVEDMTMPTPDEPVVDVSPKPDGARDKLLARSAVLAPALTKQEQDMYRTEIRAARDNKDLKAIIDEMEKAAAAARERVDKIADGQDSDTVDVTSSDEPDLPDGEPTDEEAEGGLF